MYLKGNKGEWRSLWPQQKEKLPKQHYLRKILIKLHHIKIKNICATDDTMEEWEDKAQCNTCNLHRMSLRETQITITVSFCSVHLKGWIVMIIATSRWMKCTCTEHIAHRLAHEEICMGSRWWLAPSSLSKGALVGGSLGESVYSSSNNQTQFLSPMFLTTCG